MFEPESWCKICSHGGSLNPLLGLLKLWRNKKYLEFLTGLGIVCGDFCWIAEFLASEVFIFQVISCLVDQLHTNSGAGRQTLLLLRIIYLVSEKIIWDWEYGQGLLFYDVKPVCTTMSWKGTLEGGSRYFRITIKKPDYSLQSGHVLWPDQPKTELFGHDDKQQIWRKKREALRPQNTIPTVK